MDKKVLAKAVGEYVTLPYTRMVHPRVDDRNQSVFFLKDYIEMFYKAKSHCHLS